MSLAPLPPLTNAAFTGGGPGDLSQTWQNYLNSLDAKVAPVMTVPTQNISAVNPQTGAPTLPWGEYWRSLDIALRSSGWMVGGMTASQVLRPLPPTLGVSMVQKMTGVLLQPWAQYLSSVDALVRPQP